MVTAVRTNVSRLQFFRCQLVANLDTGHLGFDIGQLGSRQDFDGAQLTQAGQRTAFLNLSSALGIGDVQSLLFMIFKIDVDVFCLHLGQDYINLLGSGFAGNTVHNAITDGTELSFCCVYFRFECFAQINIFDVCNIGNDVSTAGLEVQELRNLHHLRNLTGQRINLLHREAEIVQLGRSIELRLIVAEFVSYSSASLLQHHYFCCIYQRLAPQVEAVVQLVCGKHRRVCQLLCLGKQLGHTFFTVVRIVQQSRIDIQHFKQLLQLGHRNLSRSGQVLKFVQVHNAGLRNLVQIGSCDGLSVLSGNNSISAIYHRQEDDRCENELNLELLVNIHLHKTRLEDVGIVQNTLRRQIADLVNVVSRIL